MSDGDNASDGTDRIDVRIEIEGKLVKESDDGSALIETETGSILVGPNQWERCEGTATDRGETSE